MEENEKSQSSGGTATRPGLSLPDLLETDTLPILRSELESARNEYRLGHFAEVRTTLTKLLSRLESSLASGDDGPEAAQRHLIHASALTIFGQTQKSTDANEYFKRAVDEFMNVNVAGDQSADVYGDFGIALYYAGQPAEAIAIFEKGAEKGSLSAEAYLLYGLSLSQQQDNPERLQLAEKQFRESVNLSPGDPRSYQILGTNLEAQDKLDEATDNYRQAAALLMASGMVNEAQEVVDRALEIRPRDAELLAVKGFILVALDRTDESLRFLDDSLFLNPDQALTLGMKGQSLVLLGREEEGLDCLRRAVALDSSQPWLFFTLGFVLSKMGRNEEALEPLDKAILLAPDYAMAIAAKGAVHAYLRQNEAARDALQRAVELDPNLAWAHAALVGTLLQLKQPAEAVVALDHALSISPNDLNLAIVKARALRESGRNAEALKMLEHLAESNADSVHVLAALGEAYYFNRNYATALETIETALQSDPDFVPALATKGRALRALDRYSEAVEILKQAIALDSLNVVARAELGGALRRLGKLEESLKELEEALKLDPHNTLALGHKGETLRKMGRNAEALEILDTGLKLDPVDPWLMVTKGAVLRVWNRAKEAVDLVKRAVEIDPNMPRGWAELGVALYTEDKNEEALSAFERALALKPNYDLALKYKGETLRYLDRNEEALICLDQALAVSPDDAWTLGAKAQTLRALNRELEASDTLERAVKLDPHLTWAWTELGFSYQAQEQPAEAISALTKSLALSFNAEGALYGALLQCDIAEYDAALELLDRAIQVAPEFADLYGLKGWVHENQGVDRGHEAHKEYSKANELRPDELVWQGGLANSLFLLNRLSEAEEQYADVLKKAIKIESPGNDILSLIGWCNYRLRNYEEAIRTFISLVRENPADISDQFNLGLALFANRQDSLSRREYQRGVELANRKPKLLQRGWFHVAIDDMNVAITIQPELYDNSDFRETRDVMRGALREAKKPEPKTSSKVPNLSSTLTG